MKINELQHRVMELEDNIQAQLELMSVFARHISDMANELKNDENRGERKVQFMR